MADDDGFYDDFYTGYDGFEEPEAVSFNDNWSDAPSDEVKEGNTAGGEPEEKFEIKTIAVKDTLGNVPQHYQVLDAEGLDQERLKAEKTVANRCGMTLEMASGLMRHYEWNEEKVVGLCLDDLAAAKKESGLSDWPSDISYDSQFLPSPTAPGGGFTCMVCFDDFSDLHLGARSPCGHSFCNACWYQYFITYLSGRAGGSSGRKPPRCMAHKCTCQLPNSFVRCVLLNTLAKERQDTEGLDWDIALERAKSEIPEITFDAVIGGRFAGMYNQIRESSAAARSNETEDASDNLFKLWQSTSPKAAVPSAPRPASAQPSAAQKTSTTVSSNSQKAKQPDTPQTIWYQWLGKIRRAYVDANRHTRWCPAPGCEFAIRRLAESTEAAMIEVSCACGHRICFLCDAAEPHSPAPCFIAAMWRLKCSHESEAAHWIMNNTKPCPRCRVRIEKNSGCNHMTCSSCQYEFCWVCDGDWKAHIEKSVTEAYHCNKFNPAKKTVTKGDLEAAQQAPTQDSRESVVRYLFYYTRYHNNHMAQHFAVRQRKKVEQRMAELQQNNEDIEWSDVEFMREANEQIIESRRILKFSYVLGYFLKEGKEKNLLEYLQQQLEQATELLTENVEREHTIDSGKLMSLARVSKQFAQKLIEGVERGLTAGEDNYKGGVKMELYNTFGLDQEYEREMEERRRRDEDDSDAGGSEQNQNDGQSAEAEHKSDSNGASTTATEPAAASETSTQGSGQLQDAQGSGDRVDSEKSKKGGLFGWLRS